MNRRRVLAKVLVAAAASLAGLGACRREDHAHLSTFVRPTLPAGFAEHSRPGWHVAAPATWKDGPDTPPALWSAVDPQAVDDYRANVNVLSEPFGGESYAYAMATVDAIRRNPRATVEVAREGVVDGDPTFIVESRWSPFPPSTVAIRTMQANLASRGTGYVVTCSVSAGAFERYRSTCESIVRSLAVER